MRTETIQIAGGDTTTPLNMQKRIVLISRHVRSGPGTRILDCGCGCGGYVRVLRATLGVDAIGVEYSRDKIAEAKKQLDVAPYVTQGDIQELPYRPEEFDVVLLNEVIEHVPDELLSLREIRRVLKPGGKLIVFCPNRLFPFETHRVVLRGCKTYLPPQRVPFIPYIPVSLGRLVFQYWARNYWPWELRRLMVRAGFKILQADYVWLTFENISGNQHRLIKRFEKRLRSVSNWGERSVVKCFGTSQFLVCQK